MVFVGQECLLNLMSVGKSLDDFEKGSTWIYKLFIVDCLDFGYGCLPLNNLNVRSLWLIKTQKFWIRSFQAGEREKQYNFASG